MFFSQNSYSVMICLTSFELGGAERQALNLALLLKREGIRVVMASFSNQGPIQDICQKSNIPTVEFSRKITLISILSTAIEINKHNIDIIFSYCDYANIMMALVFPFTQASRLFWGQRDAGIGLNVIKDFPKILDLPTAAISNSIAGEIFLQTLSKNIKIYHIPNVIQPNPPLFSRSQWRQKLGITKEKTVFLMIANLSKLKAHDLLLHAWSLAQTSKFFAQKAVLLLAGREDEQACYLHQLARDLEINDSVIFLGQISDISGLITAADICIFSSYKEGLPNGILECMYYGLPVIALANHGTCEACAAVDGNVLIKDYTPISLKDGILKLYSNNHLKCIGKNNEIYVKNNFSQKKFIDCYLKIIMLCPGNKHLMLKIKSLSCLLLFYFSRLKNKIIKLIRHN